MSTPDTPARPVYHCWTWREHDVWVIRIAGTTGGNPDVVDSYTQSARREEIDPDIRDFLALMLTRRDAQAYDFDITVREITYTDPASIPPGRLAVYCRLGEEGRDYRIGTVAAPADLAQLTTSLIGVWRLFGVAVESGSETGQGKGQS